MYVLHAVVSVVGSTAPPHSGVLHAVVSVGGCTRTGPTPTRH